LQLMREVPNLPFARLRMDQTYNWLSNASYAKSSANVLASWQTISSIEAAWAPSISTMPEYDKFFPEAGIRASFFNYFQQEEPSQSNDLSIYDLGVVQDFVLTNLFLRANKQVSDELTVGLSFDYNGYFYLNGQDERQATSIGPAGPANFLNEFAFAYNSSWFHPFNDKQGISLNWRASYVFADSPGSAPYSSSYLTRTDNSLTGTYFVNLSDKITLSPFASYRLAYYTDAQNAPPGSDNDGTQQNGFYRRLDQQYTLGLGLTFALTPELATGLSFNYSKSDSTSRIVETGDFTNLTAGANWSMTYKFSEKEFVVTDHTDCLGPFVRTDLGFSFPNNLNSSQNLTGAVLPGVTGSLANASLSVNPGVRFDVTPGFNFSDWLGAEFSAGILYNGLDHLNGTGLISTGSGSSIPVGGGGVAITGRYLQVPALVSSVFRWPGKGRWKPYLSTGFGFAYSQLQVTEINNAQTSDQFAQQFSPAFSVGSGFYWQISDMVDFDAMYKLLGLINPYYSSFHPGVPISNSFQFGINVRF
ncbi:hypothetical protein EBX31_12535, partial [bacterium]|nr:hypothetical protein [bacterium]